MYIIYMCIYIYTPDGHAIEISSTLRAKVSQDSSKYSQKSALLSFYLKKFIAI